MEAEVVEAEVVEAEVVEAEVVEAEVVEAEVVEAAEAAMEGTAHKAASGKIGCQCLLISNYGT